MLETVNPEKRDGPVARAIEDQTAKIPSQSQPDTYHHASNQPLYFSARHVSCDLGWRDVFRVCVPAAGCCFTVGATAALALMGWCVFEFFPDRVDGAVGIAGNRLCDDFFYLAKPGCHPDLCTHHEWPGHIDVADFYARLFCAIQSSEKSRIG